jgi:Uma2 family endonuclease
MTVGKTLLTAEELLQLPSGDGRYELLHGELVEMSPANGRHNEIITEVAFYLRNHVRPRRLGKVLTGDTGIILARNPDHVRAPDICFISAARVPRGPMAPRFVEIVPDLVVEIVSPGDSAAKVHQKTEEWLQAGAQLVWTLYPETRSIAVSDAAAGTRVYHDGETLHGEPVLPGFAVPVAALFDAE